MPIYEYRCEDCDALFEELFTNSEEAKEYEYCHPCKSCDSIASRVVSSTNFQFVGTPGQSGSHDLDYPTLDKAVGRSAAKKWDEIYARKEKIDKVRQEIGQHAVSADLNGNAAPLPKLAIEARKVAVNAFSKALKNRQK
jgi:putative FmdB family regulatory protein